MTVHQPYTPGAADLARVERDGEHWTLVVVRDLRHPAHKVWQALTDPEQLRAWAPFDADADLGKTGRTVRLGTVGTPQPMVSETVITCADAPRLLQYRWGDGLLRWELQGHAGGTRLSLSHGIPRDFAAMGAAGWHICLDVLERALGGEPIGRIVGPSVMQFEGWQQLRADYARQFGLEF